MATPKRRLFHRSVDLVGRPWESASRNVQDLFYKILDWLNDSWGGVQTFQKTIQIINQNNPQPPGSEFTGENNLAKFSSSGITLAKPLTSSDVMGPDGFTENFFHVQGTLATNPGAGQYGTAVNISSSPDSTSGYEVAFSSFLGPGYTGPAATWAGYFENSVAGTLANFSVDGQTGFNTTTGVNLGVRGLARDGAVNIGTMGEATVAKNAATNIGVLGFGRNTGASPINIGGYFGLNTSSFPPFNPTFTSAALVADNAALTDPIFLARDNGVTKVAVQDGGTLDLIQGTLTSQVAALNHTATWNNAAVDFLGIKSNITYTAAGPSSRFIEFQKNGTRIFSVAPQVDDGPGNDDGFLTVGGTMPSSHTNWVEAIKFYITGAGSATNAGQDAVAVRFLAGYTGDEETSALGATNYNAGVDTGVLEGGFGAGNHGVGGGAVGTTTGTNKGVTGFAQNGDINIGGNFESITLKNGATNIGVFGTGRNSGTTPIEIGGYFGLHDTDPSFTGASAGLVADNGTTSNPIALFRNSGVNQVKIGDGVSADNSQHFLEVVGTLPSSPSTAVSGFDLSITGAGSSANDQVAQYIHFLSGYTGAGSTQGIVADNANAGTASSFWSGLGNAGLYGAAFGTTTGCNIGTYSFASNGDKNAGVIGWAAEPKNGATNIGVIGFGRNTGTSPIEIGGFFGLYTSEPTFTSAALVADNGGVAVPIFRGRDSGTDVWTIQDGGHVYTKMATKTLTESTDTAFVRIAVAQGASVAGMVKYDIQANDGTDFQSRSGVLQFNCVNKAGTETPGLSTPSTATEAFSESAGGSTLTNTFTTATGTDTFDIRANAVSSLTQTTLRINYTVEMWSNAVTTVTPQ